MTTEAIATFELDDIQAGALRSRPSPYAGAYFLLRIDDRRAGRELLRRITPALASAANPADPAKQAWLALGLSFHGLKALGVPEQSLASFPAAFQQGMAARAADLGDVGENAPEHWEQPLGSSDVHVVLLALAPDAARFVALVERARAALS
jgi:deferrochelatase/peroxidase EfeB